MSQFDGTDLNESNAPHVILKTMMLPDEKVLAVGKVSLGIYWTSVATLIVSVALVFVMMGIGFPSILIYFLGGVLALHFLYVFIKAYLTKHYLLLVATDKRLIIRVGIFNLEILQMRYKQVESSEVASTIPGRFFGYSTVLITGTGSQTLAVPYISNALFFKNTVSEVLLGRDGLEENSWEHIVSDKKSS